MCASNHISRTTSFNIDSSMSYSPLNMLPEVPRQSFRGLASAHLFNLINSGSKCFAHKSLRVLPPSLKMPVIPFKSVAFAWSSPHRNIPGRDNDSDISALVLLFAAWPATWEHYHAGLLIGNCGQTQSPLSGPHIRSPVAHVVDLSFVLPSTSSRVPPPELLLLCNWCFVV